MLADLYMRLEQDPWRNEYGFTPEVAEATRLLLQSTTDEQRASVLGTWLEKYQPCLFGRVAVRKGLINYCFLTEEDLLSPDLLIRTKIQEARTLWTRLAYEGKRSAFILLAISDRLVNALPDKNLLAFTKQLASLFLLEDVAQDQIYLDEIFLEMPGQSRMTWRWNVGINYFGAAGKCTIYLTIFQTRRLQVTDPRFFRIQPIQISLLLMLQPPTPVALSQLLIPM